jgi:hypothetical protein
MIEPNSTIKLNSKNGTSVTMPPTCLLVFLDETGDVLFRDHNYPVFGIGGCAVLAGDYLDRIARPWKNMKEMYFGDSEVQLHASTISPTTTQLNALGVFFRSHPFCRIAVTLSDKSILSDATEPYQITARVLLERIKDVSRWLPLTQIALIVESSTTWNKYAERWFQGYRFQITEEKKQIDIPINGFFMPKKSIEPGIEVADFIIQAAGAQSRVLRESQTTPKRRDFSSIFKEVDNKLIGYLNINHVETKQITSS